MREKGALQYRERYRVGSAVQYSGSKFVSVPA